MIDVHGRFISVGMPEGAGQEVKSQDLAFNGVLIRSSHLGSRKQTLVMLQLAADKAIKSSVDKVQISEENLSKAVGTLQKTDIRYCFTLIGYDKGFWCLDSYIIVDHMVA